MSATYAQRKALGAFGERLATRHLERAGLVILDRNWRCRAGEIDIVARDGQSLVICEVKTRSSARFGTPIEAITVEKTARLHRLGAIWIEQHRGRFVDLRVDVVAVVAPRRGRPDIQHLVAVG